MDKTAIEAELRQAGADSVRFEYSYGYLVGIIVSLIETARIEGRLQQVDQRIGEFLNGRAGQANGLSA